MHRRRAFLTLAIGSIVAFPELFSRALRKLRSQPRSKESADRGTPIDWDAFLEELERIANGHENYLSYQRADASLIDRLAGTLNLQQIRARGFPLLNRSRIEHPDLTLLLRKERFEVAMLSFQPGDHIPAHDHPTMAAVSACILGGVKIWNYDSVNCEANAGTRLLRPVKDVVLGAGQTSLLTAAHGNIHDLTAVVESQIVDILTPSYNPDRARRSRSYFVDPASKPDNRGLLTAVVCC